MPKSVHVQRPSVPVQVRPLEPRGSSPCSPATSAPGPGSRLHILNGGSAENCASGRYGWFMLLDTRLFPAGAFGGVAPCLRLALAKVSMRRTPRRLAPLHRAASRASHCHEPGQLCARLCTCALRTVHGVHCVHCAGDNKSAGRQCAAKRRIHGVVRVLM